MILDETRPWAAGVLTRSLDALVGLPALVVAVACLVATGLVGVAEYLTGPDVSLSVFYLLPVLAAGGRGPKLGLKVAVVSATVWFVADYASHRMGGPSVLVLLWNVSVRFLVFCIVVALIAALQRTLTYERLLSRRDQLTGLANLRAFYEVADAELGRLARTGLPLTLAYIDIDDFKALNDHFGHAAGDQVIVATGQLLASGLRGGDTIARIGGDEFALLLPETDGAEAKNVLRRLHVRLQSEAVAHGWGIGYSGGAVTFAAPGHSVATMVADADRLMYEAKRSGKNSIRFVAA